ncbi:MAG: hypothetical protein JXN60_04020 [Lentisphaerae bacterium]|nr:hypothetical protein [Lentisphaerota bacterium]
MTLEGQTRALDLTAGFVLANGNIDELRLRGYPKMRAEKGEPAGAEYVGTARLIHDVRRRR